MSLDKSEDFKKYIKKFIDDVESMEISDDNGFLDEYLLIQEVQMKNHNSSLMDVGKLECNLKKNRYKDIVPYDNHRVVLSSVEGDQSSDYINASRIEGVRGRGDYIASQAPLIGTVNDFWRMIWEYNVEIIFMACRLVEMKKIKCQQYWSNLDTPEEFGEITVLTETEEEIMTECIRRNLRVTKGGEVHYVTQFHYCGWPDHGIPENPEDIRDIMDMMRKARQNNSAPLLVHCSAGCGRTGAIIAIDYAWTLLEDGIFDKTFNLFELICHLRKQRMSLVQTPDQYALVNKVLKSLCEDKLKKLTSHTYENVEFNQELFNNKDRRQASEDNVYEDIWSLATDSQVKSSVLIPEESSVTKERYLGRSEVPEKLSQVDREVNGASSLYENVTEMERKIQEDSKSHQEQPSDTVNNQKTVHKTLIRISSTKRPQVSAIDVVKDQHAYSPASHSERSDLKEGHEDVRHHEHRGTTNLPAPAALTTYAVTSTTQKVREGTVFSVFKRQSGAQRTQSETSQQPPVSNITEISRDKSKSLPRPALPAKSQKPQSFEEKAANSFSKKWSSMKSHRTVPPSSQYQYSNTTSPTDAGLFSLRTKPTSPRVSMNNKVYDFSRPPDSRSHTVDGTNRRSFSTSSRDSRSARPTTAELRPEFQLPLRAPVSPGSPKYKGFVLLNSQSSGKGHQQPNKQQKEMFFL